MSALQYGREAAVVRAAAGRRRAPVSRTGDSCRASGRVQARPRPECAGHIPGEVVDRRREPHARKARPRYGRADEVPAGRHGEVRVVATGPRARLPAGGARPGRVDRCDALPHAPRIARGVGHRHGDAGCAEGDSGLVGVEEGARRHGELLSVTQRIQCRASARARRERRRVYAGGSHDAGGGIVVQRAGRTDGGAREARANALRVKIERGERCEKSQGRQQQRVTGSTPRASPGSPPSHCRTPQRHSRPPGYKSSAPAAAHTRRAPCRSAGRWRVCFQCTGGCRRRSRGRRRRGPQQRAM